MTEETKRTWKIFGISAFIAALIIIFFSGIFPVENLVARLPKPCPQPAAVLASAVVNLTNENRTSDGLPTLATSALLTEAAQDKADDMAANSYYAHVSPDGKSPLYWLQKVGYKYLNAGENLVIDRTTSEQVVDAWMASPDHRENILRPQFTEIGVGVAQGEYEGIKTTFVVQEFGTPYPVAAPIALAKPITQAIKPAVQPATIATSSASTPQVVPAPKKSDALTQGSAALSAPVTTALPIASLVPTIATSTATDTVEQPSNLFVSETRYTLPLGESLPINLYASDTLQNCST